MRSLVLHSDHLGGDVDPSHPLDGVRQTAHDVQHLPSDSGKYFVTENGWNIVEAQMAQISTNDSTVSRWIWTNKSAPLWRKP